MSFETDNLTERVGTRVQIDVDTLLEPESGAALRRLLVERGVLVFKQLHLSDEDQVTLAGALRLEAIRRYATQSTGGKFLIRPHL